MDHCQIKEVLLTEIHREPFLDRTYVFGFDSPSEWKKKRVAAYASKPICWKFSLEIQYICYRDVSDGIHEAYALSYRDWPHGTYRKAHVYQWDRFLLRNSWKTLPLIAECLRIWNVFTFGRMFLTERPRCKGNTFNSWFFEWHLEVVFHICFMMISAQGRDSWILLSSSVYFRLSQGVGQKLHPLHSAEDRLGKKCRSGQ